MSEWRDVLKTSLLRKIYFAAALSLSAAAVSQTVGNDYKKADATVSYYDLSDPSRVTDSSLQSGQNVTYSTVYFGEYPQTMVKKSSPVYKKLIKSDVWKDDVVRIDGKKYKRLSYSSVIEDKGKRAGNNILSADNLSDYKTGKYVYNDESSYVYFRYDPLKWRILNNDGAKVILVTDKIIDGVPYSSKNSSSRFSESRVSDFLNNDFLKEAVPSEYQNDILTESESKVFTLSETDMNETGSNAYNFGFARGTTVKDEARRAAATDYAWASGVCRASLDSSSVRGFSAYWIESAADNSIKAVRPDGSVASLDIKKSRRDIYGVRPCIYMSLSSAEQLFTAGGKISSADTSSLGFSDEGKGGEKVNAELKDVSYSSEAADQNSGKYKVKLVYTVNCDKKADGFFIKVPDGRGGSRKLFAPSDTVKADGNDENTYTVTYDYNVSVPYSENINLKVRPYIIKDGSLKFSSWTDAVEKDLKAEKPSEKSTGNKKSVNSTSAAAGQSPLKRNSGNSRGRVAVFILIAVGVLVFYTDWYLRNHKER